MLTVTCRWISLLPFYRRENWGLRWPRNSSNETCILPSAALPPCVSFFFFFLETGICSRASSLTSVFIYLYIYFLLPNAACGILVPWPKIKSTLLAVETAGPPGKSHVVFLKITSAYWLQLPKEKSHKERDFACIKDIIIIFWIDVSLTLI